MEFDPRVPAIIAKRAILPHDVVTLEPDPAGMSAVYYIGARDFCGALHFYAVERYQLAPLIEW